MVWPCLNIARQHSKFVEFWTGVPSAADNRKFPKKWVSNVLRSTKSSIQIKGGKQPSLLEASKHDTCPRHIRTAINSLCRRIC